ncbi:hypothetical protein MC04F11_42340 [Escherichia coli]
MSGNIGANPVTELVHWSESDAKYYQEAIGQTLKDYLPDQGEKSE